MGHAPVTFQNRLFSLFNIHSGEGRLVTLLLIHAFFIGTARIFTRTAAFTLFLIEFDATRTLPYVYVGISVIVSLTSLLYLKLGERLPLAKLLITNLGFLLLVLVGFWAGLELTAASWLIFALPIGYELLYTFTNLEFWKLNGRLFNVRQGKRLFGLVGAGKTAAIIVGGLLVPLLVNVLGTINLLLVAAVAIAVALGFLVYISGVYKDQLSAPTRKTPAGDIKSTATLLKNHYILLIVSFFALGVIAYFFIDNIFYTQAQVRFPNEDQLASFIGLFFGFAGLLTLFGQSFLTGRIIRYYGLRWVGLLLSPITLLVSTILIAIGGTILGGVGLLFSLATLTKLISVIFRETIDHPVTNVLYQPLSAYQRTQAQTVVEGLSYPVAVGLAGVVLAMLTTFLGFDGLQLTYVLILILAAWLGTAILVGHRYLTALMEALSTRRLTGGSMVIVDRSSQLVLRRALQNQNPAVAIYALNVLAESEPENIATYLPSLLSHPVPEVRHEALERIEQLGLNSTLESVQQVIKVDASTRVQAHALRVLVALGKAETLEHLYPYLEDPDPQLRLGAIIGALRHGDVATSLIAQGRLLQLALSLEPSDRVLACEALGTAQSNNLEQLLGKLLQDEEPQVRRAAMESAGQVQYADLWPAVIAGITEPETRGAATAALVAGGETVLPNLGATFGESDLSQEAMTRLARVCGRIGGDQAVALLFDNLSYPDKEVRTSVFAALSQCGFRANEKEQVTVQRQIDVELSQATSILASLADINSEADNNSTDQDCLATGLLSESLNAELKQFQSRLILLLSFIYEAKSMQRARDTLSRSYASADEQAHAVEVIDVLVPPELKARLLPLLDKMSLDLRLSHLSRYYPQPRLGRTDRLREIISTPAQQYDRWIKACALYAIASLGVSDLELAQQIAAISHADTADPFLAETASWTLAQLSQSELVQNSDLSNHNLNSRWTGNQLRFGANSNDSSLSTIEKIVILKKIGVFARIPAGTLIDLAALVTEIRSRAGQLIISKGDAGDCLYIIAGGTVRVHDGTSTINHLGVGDVFGEMALLEPEPRSASVTAIEDTHLLRLDQKPFYQLTEDRIEIVRGIIRVLSHRLRSSVSDLTQLRSQLETSEYQPALLTDTTE